MHKKIVSTCSPNNNMYSVCIQYIVKKFPDGFIFSNSVRSNSWKFRWRFSVCFLDYSVGVRSFVIGPSQISTFFF